MLCGFSYTAYFQIVAFKFLGYSIFRLNHPVRTVRNRISELLCRIAEEHSQLVIYPAVVGSMSAASSDTFSKLLSSNVDKLVIDGDADGNDDDESPEMQSAHAKIVDAIARKSKTDADSIEQVGFSTGNSNLSTRLSTVNLLINAVCFVEDEIVCNIEKSLFKLVSAKRSTFMSLPLCQTCPFYSWRNAFFQA